MADISMCYNNRCHLRHKCYRAMVIAPEGRTIGVYELNEDGTCDYYWAYKPEELEQQSEISNKKEEQDE